MRTRSQKASEHDPGTSDELLNSMRLAGRLAWRHRTDFIKLSSLGVRPCPPKGKPGRADWWLGWYDEQLKRFYGRI